MQDLFQGQGFARVSCNSNVAATFFWRPWETQLVGHGSQIEGHGLQLISESVPLEVIATTATARRHPPQLVAFFWNKSWGKEAREVTNCKPGYVALNLTAERVMAPAHRRI